MIIPAPSSVAFSVFNFPIYWYGIILASAIFVAIIIGNKFFNVINVKMRKDVIISCAPLIIISGIIGARLYFCLLNPSYYFAHPIEIFDIRQGGLSIHGAIILGVPALMISALKNKVPVMNVLDSMSCATILGQAIGRWGNYFNSEAYGFPVSGQAWGVFIPESKRVVEYMNYSLFHPTFLYESILDLFGFGILTFILFKFGKKYSGVPFFAYLTVYSVIRFFVERIRIDSALDIGSLHVAEIMSVILFVIGIAGMIFCFCKGRQSPNNI